MGTILSFRDLDAWNAAMDLVLTVYELSGSFPRHEQYGLTSQIRRAAVSIPSNIAEGHANGPGRRYRNHVCIALGSLAELGTQLELANRLNYVNSDLLRTSEKQITRARQLLNGLNRSLRLRQVVQAGLIL